MSFVRPDSLEDLLELQEQYQGRQRANMNRWFKLYQRQFAGTINLPRNVPIHESSTPAIIVDELRDQIRVDQPVVTAEVFGTSTRAKNLQEKQQIWGQGVLEATANQGLINPYGQARHDLILFGAAGLKRIVKHEILDEPKQQEGESQRDFADRLKWWRLQQPRLVPFEVRAIDPRNLYPSPGTGPLTYMLEKQARRVIDIWQSYPEWSDPKARNLESRNKNNPTRPVVWLEFWSWIWNPRREMWQGMYIVEADGERIIEEPNPYGQVPYSYAYSGLGRQNEDGDPAHLSVGILGQVAGEIEAEIMAKTALGAQWLFHVFPRLKVKGISAEEARRRFMVGPGAVIELPQQGEADWMDMPPPNQTMLVYLDKIESNMTRKVSPALSGERTADFGVHQALQIGQAIKVVGPVRESLNRMVSDTVDGMASLMKRFGLTMNVRGTAQEAEAIKTIKGSEFTNHKFHAEFEAVDPEENDRRMLAMLAVKRDPRTLSRETFRRVALRSIIDSNDEEEARLIAEAVQDQMVDSGVLLQTALERLSSREDEAELEDMTARAERQARQSFNAGIEGFSQRQRNIESLANTNLGDEEELVDTGEEEAGG